MLKRYIFSPILFLLLICLNANVYSQQADPEALFVIPSNYASNVGTATFTGPTGNTERTYQMIINSNQLTELVGTHINSISFRNLSSSTTAWPVNDITITNYDIYLAPGVAPADRQTTFAANIVGTKTQVRSGSLLIPANSYGVGTAPHPFGNPPINFNTSYLYTGGHLVIEIRHTGFTGTSRANDAIGTSTSGYATNFTAGWQGSYTGTNVTQGNFCVIQINNSPVPTGISTTTGIPAEFKLLQNYPNPFNPVTRIEYAIPFDSKVVLSVYDMLGKEIAALVNNNLQKAGNYSVEFNGANLMSGTYFYKLTAQGKENDFVTTKKMILIK